MTHPNGANSIAALNYEEENSAVLVERFVGTYGKEAIKIERCFYRQAKSHLDTQEADCVDTTDGGLLVPAYYAGNTLIEIYTA